MKADKTFSRRKFLQLGGAAVGSLGFPAIVQAAPKMKSVIVLGIDGMDHALLTRFIKEGLMPNAGRLGKLGCFTPLRTSNPPESPVAWSNFISGTNPGGHGIFDFIALDESTMLPYLSTSRMEGPRRTMRLGDWNIPLSAGKMINLRKGPTFWNELQEHGVDSTILQIPANFPPTKTGARTLSGMGTPDIHGSYGIFTFYTDKRGEKTRNVSGGQIEHVRSRDHVFDCMLAGPVNTFDPDEKKVKVPFRVFVDPTNLVARISVQNNDFILREGEWSEWITISFSMVPHLVNVSAICRFFLKKARNDFALYVSPVNIDPMDPFLPITTPERYSRELARRSGLFYTQGMAEDTSALSAGVFSDSEYRDQAVHVLNEDLHMFEQEFDRFQDGFFFYYFSSLDLNSHAFWRTIDSGHPLYSEELKKKHGDFIPWLYRQMDTVIGHAMQRINRDTVLMVMSDHGFTSFRRQFNLNSWLLDNGYAVPIRNPSRGHAGYFADIKWPGTRAFGLGINGLYLNTAGRYPDGTVAPGEEKELLIRELITGLKAVRDPKNGEQVISNVYRTSDIYSGPYVNEAPDLIVGYNVNYRASWDTILGKYPREHILDNMDPWSGDHTIDAPFVPGVFLANRKINTDRPALYDLAPTILQTFGVPIPDAMTGKSIM